MSATGSRISLKTTVTAPSSAGEISTTASICASVTQGSGLGPASFLVTAADLRSLSKHNRIIKFADDTYLIVPASNTATCHDELQHIQQWAEKNNLQLNRAKTKEIVFCVKRHRDGDDQLPPLCQNIDRVSRIVPLGITINDRMTATDHISGLIDTCSRTLYTRCVC